MKRNKNTMTEPELMCNDAHGIYMMQLTYDSLLPRYKKQALKELGEETIQDIIDGPDNEFHFDACNSLTNVTFKTETGQKFTIQYAEGGTWAIPACFARSRAASVFFGE